MRTVIIILGGFVIWAICIGIAKFLVSSSESSTTIATSVFVVIWLLAALTNMWLGVNKAGYTYIQELPIFLLIFLLPAVTAVFVNWKYL